MKSLRALLKFLIRLVVVWVVDALSLLATAALVSGITIDASSAYGALVVAIAAALVLGIVNLFVRPIILLLARSLGFIVIFLVGLFVNAIVLMITANLIPELRDLELVVCFPRGSHFLDHQYRHHQHHDHR